ncbi:hypothetical protein Peur_007771 [Populus x canadensis]
MVKDFGSFLLVHFMYMLLCIFHGPQDFKIKKEKGQKQGSSLPFSYLSPLRISSACDFSCDFNIKLHDLATFLVSFKACQSIM